MSDEHLDRLIDDVAKQLTAGQPSSDFRARVIASLDRHPRRAWWTSWIAVPLGAMAVTMIALAVARPFPPSLKQWRTTVALGEGGMGRDRGAESPALGPSRQAVKTETAPAAPTPDATTVGLPPSPPSGFSETGKADTTYEGARGTAVAAAGRRQDPSRSAAAEVAALAPPPLEVPPLGVEAIGVAALPTDSIAVTQLDAIAPIGIAPLAADDPRPSGGANEGTIDDSRRPR
jgi:hypothetical protein